MRVQVSERATPPIQQTSRSAARVVGKKNLSMSSSSLRFASIEHSLHSSCGPGTTKTKQQCGKRRQRKQKAGDEPPRPPRPPRPPPRHAVLTRVFVRPALQRHAVQHAHATAHVLQLLKEGRRAPTCAVTDRCKVRRHVLGWVA